MLQYYIQVHKCLTADSISKASEKIRQIAAEFAQLEIWEKEGKIKTFGPVNALGFLCLQVIDDSVGAKLRSLSLIMMQELDEIVDESLYPEIFGEADETEQMGESGQ
jgi:hypothetical protein